MIIWRFTDGKPGHEKQTLGLAHALLRHQTGQCVDWIAPPRANALMHWLRGTFPPADALPAPDILIGAGHATHIAMLAARRARGGKAVVLMKPSLPLFLFDLCVIPEHDAPPARDNIIRIRGALNDVQPSTTRSPEHGLMLIGGISEHYRWNEAAIAAAVQTIAQSTPHIGWQLTTSRRTPPTFPAALPQPLPTNLKLVPHSETGPGWLEHALSGAGQVWVTEDSVSMLYEALTAGAGVGILNLEKIHDGRVRRGVEKLIDDAWITPFSAWHPGAALPCPPHIFNEADRVAKQILTRFQVHAAH